MKGKVFNKISGKKVAEIVTIVLLICLIGGLIGFVAHFTNGFSGDFTTFYVTVDGEDVMSEKKDIVLQASEPLQVDVKYTLGFASKDISGYSVKVVPIADFDFTADEETYSFAAVEELEKGFVIKEEEDSFTIMPKGDMKTILKAVYPDKQIGLNNNDIPDGDLIAIKVFAKDETVCVTLSCRLNDLTVESVSLDKGVIEF